MRKKDISKKDEIILQQLEVIRTMTENNLNRMGADFWGEPAASGEKSPGQGAEPVEKAPGGQEKSENTAASSGGEAAPPAKP